MDIAALSMLKGQAQLQQGVGIAVMRKAMCAAEQNGGLVGQMLGKVAEGKDAVQASLPHLGKNLDLYV